MHCILMKPVYSYIRQIDVTQTAELQLIEIEIDRLAK
jgi:hypothetical protein